MELQDAIFGRRSISKYADKPIGSDVLNRLLEMAIYAPTGGNIQCRRFGVITESKLLRLIESVGPSLFAAQRNLAASHSAKFRF